MMMYCKGCCSEPVSAADGCCWLLWLLLIGDMNEHAVVRGAGYCWSNAIGPTQSLSAQVIPVVIATLADTMRQLKMMSALYASFSSASPDRGISPSSR